MDKRSQIGILIGAVALLGAAFAVGVGIRMLRLRGAQPPSQPDSPPPKPVTVRATEDQEPPDLTAQDDEFLQWLEEQMTRAEEANDASDQQDLPQQTEAGVAQEVGEFFADQGSMPQGPGDWRSIWADLNLTEEERARLREGFRRAMARWQNMSEEERQAEMDRMRAGWERWQNMSDEEKRQASQRMRDRFEQWRQSDSADLPEISLD
jgi:hypothetical protein